jgi:hypothetical protein
VRVHFCCRGSHSCKHKISIRIYEFRRKFHGKLTLTTPSSSPVARREDITLLIRLIGALRITNHVSTHAYAPSGAQCDLGRNSLVRSCSSLDTLGSSVNDATGPVSPLCMEDFSTTHFKAFDFPTAYRLVPSGFMAKPRHERLDGRTENTRLWFPSSSYEYAFT